MNKNILAIGAHPDDLEFGCVGTLVKHKLRDDNVTIVVMSKGDIKDAFSGNILRSKSESVLETKCSAEVLGLDLIHLSYEDTKVPFSVDSISSLEKIIKGKDIDTIYTHWGGDTHQDHINTLKSTLAAARTVKNVLCYEQIPIPRVSINYPIANYYVDISDVMDEKIEACKCHKSQLKKYLDSGFDMIDSLYVLARYRGNQAGVKYAEAFDLLKMVV
jgi:LmbE family N-acetylglucosaminyl deacetylase